MAGAEAPSMLDSHLAPPLAEMRPHVVSSPNGDREDPFYWLRDDSRENPDVLGYLKAENDYADVVLAPLAPLKERIREELAARLPPDDSSVPYRWKDCWYQGRYVDGADYPQVIRRCGAADGPEQMLLDQVEMAGDDAFFSLPAWDISPDQKRIAWVEDRVGRRQYTLKVKDVASGELLTDSIENVGDSFAWSGDSEALLYIENDPVTLLGKRVKLHRIGQSPEQDETVYEEADESFYLSVFGTRSEAYVCIHSESTTSSEQRCAPVEDPAAMRVIAPRQPDLLYEADHLGGRWLIRTDLDAPNWRIVEVAEDAIGSSDAWKDVVPHADDVFIEDFLAFDHFLVVDERSHALRRLRIIANDGKQFFVDADDPAYSMWIEDNPDPSSLVLRYGYESMTRPESIYEVDITTLQRKLLKRDRVSPGFDPANYVSERRFVPARDGSRIPVSLVYRKDFKRDGTAPLYQYAYGAYGLTEDPDFDPDRLSLLDRGMVYAIAHVRGGQALGRKWYDDGRLGNKMHSFTDFIDATRELVRLGYAAPGRVAAEGGSAGGLLMGAISNMAPADYRVIVADVPFVDVVTTMLDESIPLTTNEYDEWGNPNEAESYATMLAYSPYDNVQRMDYPAMYVSTGLWDSQVQYWEPAKWVAKLRRLKTDRHPLLLRTDMEAGHGGKSGRYRRLNDTAETYAFVLDQLGVVR